MADPIILTGNRDPQPGPRLAPAPAASAIIPPAPAAAPVLGTGNQQIQSHKNLFRAAVGAGLQADDPEVKKVIAGMQQQAAVAGLASSNLDFQQAVTQEFNQMAQKAIARQQEEQKRQVQVYKEYLQGLFSFEEFQKALANIPKQLQREQQEAEQKKAAIPVAQAADPAMRAAVASMEGERKTQQDRLAQAAARREIDPAFRQQEQGALAWHVGSVMGRQGGVMGAAGNVVAGMGNIARQGGLEGISAAAGGGMAGAGAALSAAAGPAMAVAAVMEELNKKLVQSIETVGKFGSKIMAVDADGLMREFNELAKSIPVVGGALGALGDAFMGMIHATDATAARLAEFSPEIAQAQAIAEQRQLIADMQRARETGPNLAKFVLERQEQQARLEKVMSRLSDKIVPILTAILEKITDWMEGAVEVTERTGVTMAAMERFINGDMRGGWEILANHVRQVAENTRVDADELADWFEKLNVTIDPVATPALPAVTAPVPPGAVP